MNALTIDCAVSKISVAARKDANLAKITLDIGTKQSEKLLTAANYVMNELSLKPEMLDYTACTSGPGSFTGLRLGMSELKALTLSGGTPLYGIPSLHAYAYPFRDERCMVISVIKSKEDVYFYNIFSSGKALQEDAEDTIENILEKVTEEDFITVCGPSSAEFVSRAAETAPLLRLCCFTPENDACESMFVIAEAKIKNKEPPLEDYDGPLYIRKSEAEIVLEKKKSEEK